MSRRCRHAAVAAVALAAAALVLSACDTPGNAAVVGDQQVTVDRLQNAVNDALNAPGVRAALPNSSYKGDLAAYRRAVLSIEVERVLAETGARRLAVAVDPAAVDLRYRYYQDQAGGATAFATSLASRDALSTGLFRELVRTEVIESEIGFAQGHVPRPTDAALQKLYVPYAAQAATATLRLVQVPDAATATRAAAALHRDPNSFATVANSYRGLPQSAPDPQQYVESRLPPDLTVKLATAKPGDTFAYTLAASQPAYFVIRFNGIQRPTLEQARPQLENASVQQAAAAGQQYLKTLAGQVHVQINPRYGEWDATKLSIKDFVNPVVKQSPTPAATSPSGVPGSGSGPGPAGGAGSTGTTG